MSIVCAPGFTLMGSRTTSVGLCAVRKGKTMNRTILLVGSLGIGCALSWSDASQGPAGRPLEASPSRARTTSQGRSLTFEDRVAAQEAIERVYYSHQIGATLSFEEAVPR